MDQLEQIRSFVFLQEKLLSVYSINVLHPLHIDITNTVGVLFSREKKKLQEKLKPISEWNSSSLNLFRWRRHLASNFSFDAANTQTRNGQKKTVSRWEHKRPTCVTTDGTHFSTSTQEFRMRVASSVGSGKTRYPLHRYAAFFLFCTLQRTPHAKENTWLSRS